MENGEGLQQMEYERGYNGWKMERVATDGIRRRIIADGIRVRIMIQGRYTVKDRTRWIRKAGYERQDREGTIGRKDREG
jgi:hypothetical protein